jgi:hypothetical protein
MGITGDFSAFDRWAKRIHSLASDTSLRQASAKLANTAVQLIDDGFDRQQSPTGARWAPKKKPDGRRVGQGRTGNLRRQRRIAYGPGGFKIGSPKASAYGRFFHGGKRGQEARPIHPGSRIPPAWERRFGADWNAHCLLKLRGR